MGFRSKVNDRVEFALKYFAHCLLVGNVAAHEVIAGILGNIRQTFYVTRVGKLVEVKEFDIAADLKQIAHKIRTDKAGSAGNEDFHVPSFHGTSRTITSVSQSLIQILSLALGSPAARHLVGPCLSRKIRRAQKRFERSCIRPPAIKNAMRQGIFL